jgi:hypothetical protein
MHQHCQSACPPATAIGPKNDTKKPYGANQRQMENSGQKQDLEPRPDKHAKRERSYPLRDNMLQDRSAQSIVPAFKSMNPQSIAVPGQAIASQESTQPTQTLVDRQKCSETPVILDPRSKKRHVGCNTGWGARWESAVGCHSEQRTCYAFRMLQQSFQQVEKMHSSQLCKHLGHYSPVS